MARAPATIVSTLALVVSCVAFLGLMQSEGGLVDSCHSFSFFDVSTERCRAIGKIIADAGQDERGWLALAISKARAENCFALGMGIGALFALFFLQKGTEQVRVVHLMHAAWAGSVALVNAQNAGLLTPTAPAEVNVDAASQEKLRPFVVITGVQFVLDITAFLLSSGPGQELTSRKKKA